ncbi:MAG: M24 family metallopeptidase, partial [Chitinophagales bacterium]|nr:M24 family metallopeptidase [Hyphomicrobiales bacterium]
GSLFLIDSGGQYQDGTTDITRTVAIGAPTDDMRRHFTVVLKAHIALATVRFPASTKGVELDGVTRRVLWQEGLDYDHGTGHGVGSYLSVHEGPQSISKRGMAVLEPGMIVSNEPGYYREGHYGIRIENLMLVTPPAPIAGGEREMMGFDTLTLAPIDVRLVNGAMLTPDELCWLNDYHARVLGAFAQGLTANEAEWLKVATQPLTRPNLRDV